MIAISAGHNKKARGAGDQGFFEYPETLIWAVELIEVFENLYPGDPLLKLVIPGSLSKKVNQINRLVDEGEVKMAVEFHFNSSPGGGAQGSETLCYPGSHKGRILAGIIQKRLGRVFMPSRGVKDGWYKMDRPGIVDYDGDVDGDETPDYFLRKTKCPALVIEPEFIQNKDIIRLNKIAALTAIAKSLKECLVALKDS